MLGVRGLGIIIFGFLMFLVIAKRPKFLTTADDEWKSFGFGVDQTCCNITVITVVIALLSYLLSAFTVAVISSKFKQRGGGQSPIEVLGTSPRSSSEVLVPSEVSPPQVMPPPKQLAFDAQFFA